METAIAALSALAGAVIGAGATVWATRRSISATTKASEDARQKDAERSRFAALAALESELKINRDIVNRSASGAGPITPSVGRTALDWSLPFLPSLSQETLASVLGAAAHLEEYRVVAAYAGQAASDLIVVDADKRDAAYRILTDVAERTEAAIDEAVSALGTALTPNERVGCSPASYEKS
jgi:hypothetical protein